MKSRTTRTMKTKRSTCAQTSNGHQHWSCRYLQYCKSWSDTDDLDGSQRDNTKPASRKILPSSALPPSQLFRMTTTSSSNGKMAVAKNQMDNTPL